MFDGIYTVGTYRHICISVLYEHIWYWGIRYILYVVHNCINVLSTLDTAVGYRKGRYQNKHCHIGGGIDIAASFLTFPLKGQSPKIDLLYGKIKGTVSRDWFTLRQNTRNVKERWTDHMFLYVQFIHMRWCYEIKFDSYSSFDITLAWVFI